MSDQTITITRDNLAKVLSVQAVGFISILTGKEINKEALDKSYKIHMEKGFLERVVTGLTNDFENFEVRQAELKEELEKAE